MKKPETPDHCLSAEQLSQIVERFNATHRIIDKCKTPWSLNVKLADPANLLVLLNSLGDAGLLLIDAGRMRGALTAALDYLKEWVSEIEKKEEVTHEDVVVFSETLVAILQLETGL